jgi:peptidyl-tRNA hydrolase (EC 3.1.1.29)
MFNFWPFNRNKEETIDTMKYLIVGLGNIGAEYANTRHNIGFDVLDSMAEEKSLKWESVRYGSMASYKFKGRTLLLLKPNTFMNLSGQAVSYHLKREKIELDRLLVVVDDLNIDFGRKRLRPQGSDGGHNGLKHINEILGTKEYPRLRLGIGSQFSKGQQVHFVLGKWDETEQNELGEILKASADMVKGFATIGLQRTMSQYNS